MEGIAAILAVNWAREDSRWSKRSSFLDALVLFRNVSRAYYLIHSIPERKMLQDTKAVTMDDIAKQRTRAPPTSKENREPLIRRPVTARTELKNSQDDYSMHTNLINREEKGTSLVVIGCQ